MGYYTILIEGTGPHGNPDFEFDANRMANELVLQLKARGHDIRRASFLFDYKGDDAGDTLPYVTTPWPNPEPNSVEFKGEPYSVVRIRNAKGTDHFRLAYNPAREPLPGIIEKRGFWHTDPKFVQGVAERNNLAAAKVKPVSGASTDEPEPSWMITDEESGRVTRYWWRPAEGVTYRARSEGGDREPFAWEETYDLDLGSEVYLSWTYGVQDGFDHLEFKDRPQTDAPIGAHMYWPDEASPSHISGGGITFSSAPEGYRTYMHEGVKKAHPTWEVESWAPLTVSPSILHYGHTVNGGKTSDKHGFIRYGKWCPA